MPLLEDTHHLFVHCPKFSSLPATYQKRLRDTIEDSLHVIHTLSQVDQSFIFEQIWDLFTDSHIWPSCRTAYYLSILPTLIPSSHVGTRVHVRVTHITHLVCIQLAGRIWGEVRRKGFLLNSNSHRVPSQQPAILLPPHLACLFPRFVS